MEIGAVVGDRTEAEEVLKSMTPLVFFDINEENINLYIKGSYSNIMDGYTVGDVKKTLLNNIKKFNNKIYSIVLSVELNICRIKT